jgi:beta-glucosidase-like glycosyl hydrolase/CubicO group peptidase (beta-lactamase class C family)
MKRVLFVVLIFMLSIAAVWSTLYKKSKNIEAVKPAFEITTPPFIGKNKAWVDSVMKKLTPDQRIGQLFMVAAYSNKPQAHQDEIATLIKKSQVGGLIFMQGGPARQAQLCNYYQQISNVPLMISIDGEWGLAMRLDSTQAFPKQMTLGAIQNDTLIYLMGKEIARQCKRMGIHVNFAPVVDVNNNASNPVINMRSFGENKYNVARKGIAYMKGMQDAGVLSNAKHFPGHGDTDVDSHKALPTINHSRSRLDSLELYPFRELIRNGLGSVMVAHLFVPALDSTKALPTTLSQPVVTRLLKQAMDFQGLVFTDALNMKGISTHDQPGFVDVKALLAGNDVLLFAEDVPVAIQQIKKAIEEKKITQDEIDQRCRKILEAKAWLGLKKDPKISLKNLYTDLHTNASELLCRQLTEASLTVLENKQILPLNNLETLKIASLSIDDKSNSVFNTTLNLYTKVDGFSAEKELLNAQKSELLKKLKNYNVVIIGIHNPKNTMSKSAGMTKEISELIENLSQHSRVIVNLFANPYSLNKLNINAKPEGLIVSYEDNPLSQELSAQLIFGGIKANGQLPVTVNERFKAGSGKVLSDITRLKYTLPEELGIRSELLDAVDDIAQTAIRSKATPGCQVLIAKNGKVFYNKAFGSHTYSSTSSKVKTTDLYDIASISKVAASTISIMRLVDERFIDIDKTIGDYIPFLKASNKGGMRVRDLLAHQAGLPAWIPFYTRTISNETTRARFYRKERSDSFPWKVADNMFLRVDYPDSMLTQIITCDVNKSKEYKYSDLGYYFFKYIIEKHSNKSLDRYVDSVFYKPMGLSRITYNPLNKFNKDEIVPTEQDNLFRKQLIHGYVHDQGAAMMGGVGGHAGIFADANNLATLMQMLLNKGEYGGKRYLTKATIDEFIRCQFCENENRRGLGFDKPEMNYSKTGPTCKCVSALSFGHTGFTGTIAWVDPEQQLIYIFLSNRVYPDAENKKLSNLATRVEIQDAIYSIIN